MPTSRYSGEDRTLPVAESAEVMVALSVVPFGGQTASGLRLKDGAVAVPALASHVRPALVVAERETRELLAAAARQDVRLGGRFAAGPAGIQVWDRPFDGPGATIGSAVHLGTVDWSFDTPAKHFVTIYRVMATQAGAEAGHTTLAILTAVLSLVDLPADGARVTLPAPPARDPFRRLASTG